MTKNRLARYLAVLLFSGGALPWAEQGTDIRCPYARYVECTAETCSYNTKDNGYVLVPQRLFAPPSAPRFKDGLAVEVRLCDDKGCQSSPYSAWNVGAFVELMGPAHDIIKIGRDELVGLSHKGAFTRVFTTGTIVRAYFGTCRVG